MARAEGLYRIGVGIYTFFATVVAMVILIPLTVLHAVLDIIWRSFADRDFRFGETAADQLKRTKKWSAENYHYAATGNGSPSWTADNTGLRAV